MMADGIKKIAFLGSFRRHLSLRGPPPNNEGITGRRATWKCPIDTIDDDKAYQRCKMGVSFSSPLEADRKEAKILMVGLDGAGKTTILYKLKLGEVVTTFPTIGFNNETIQNKNLSLDLWDVGSQDKLRLQPFWQHHYPDTEGIIFVVDSNNFDRIQDARDELHKILSNEELKGAILLVYTNKQDMPNVMSISDMKDKLGLYNLHSRQWYIQSCCATTGDGLYDGLDWLSTAIVKQRRGLL